MEYQFTHSVHGVVAKCSMDHEAFARWLNTEVIPESNIVDTIFIEIAKCKRHPQYESVFEGREYSLFLNAEEVMVKANNIDDFFDETEMEQGFNFYDDESIGFCGLEDFELFLQAYDQFTKTYH